MRKLLIATLVTAGLSAPAFAGDKTTIEHAVANGIVMSVMGYDIPVEYNDDGTYTADVPQMGEMQGTWRVDGTKFCSESSMQPESCTEYPEGKVPGDSFTVQGAMGPATITINE